MLTLVTGPVRSGKSSFALELARASGKSPLYVATLAADRDDPEIVARIERHRADRGTMRAVEVDGTAGPTLIATIAGAASDDVLIVDSLGSWLGGVLVREPAVAESTIDLRENELLDACLGADADTIVVAEETGWGVVPAYASGRAFRDRLGRLTAAFARRADRAFLIVAGYAIDLHAVGRPVQPRSLIE